MEPITRLSIIIVTRIYPLTPQPRPLHQPLPEHHPGGGGAGGPAAAAWCGGARGRAGAGRRAGETDGDSGVRVDGGGEGGPAGGAAAAGVLLPG